MRHERRRTEFFERIREQARALDIDPEKVVAALSRKGVRSGAIESVVTRSISGHLTERMQDHYSTVNPDEQRASIARVIDLMAIRDERLGAGGAPGGAPVEQSGAPNEKTG